MQEQVLLICFVGMWVFPGEQAHHVLWEHTSLELNALKSLFLLAFCGTRYNFNEIHGVPSPLFCLLSIPQALGSSSSSFSCISDAKLCHHLQECCS